MSAVVRLDGVECNLHEIIAEYEPRTHETWALSTVTSVHVYKQYGAGNTRTWTNNNIPGLIVL